MILTKCIIGRFWDTRPRRSKRSGRSGRFRRSEISVGPGGQSCKGGPKGAEGPEEPEVPEGPKKSGMIGRSEEYENSFQLCLGRFGKMYTLRMNKFLTQTNSFIYFAVSCITSVAFLSA